ncbi:putative zinc finger protein [Cryptosporidium felis]|nr:putative zinc finger protein [Cryptosporidium felis]
MSRVDNYGRRVWDKDFYSKSREERESIRDAEDGKKSSGQILELSPEEIAKKRESYLDISKNITSSERNRGSGDDGREASGYWCELCELSFNDSHTWIRHLNSQKHNQKMGTSLYIEKKSLDSVKKRLSKLIEDFDKGTGIFGKKNARDFENFGNPKKIKNAGDKKESYLDSNLEDDYESDTLDEETKRELLKFDFPSSFL